MIDGLVSEKPVEHGPRQRLRALYHWITGAPSSAGSSPVVGGPPEGDAAPERIGHYAITRKLGPGAWASCMRRTTSGWAAPSR